MTTHNFNAANLDDEHLPQDLLNRLFADDPLDMSAFAEVSADSHLLPLVTTESAAKIAALAKEAAELDTVVAVMRSIPDARHFSSPNALVWLADLKGISITQMATLSATYHCTPSQALKVMLIGRALIENKALPLIDQGTLWQIVQALETHGSDKALWEGWLMFAISSDDVRKTLERYSLGRFDSAAQVVVAHRALRFDGVILPVSDALARIARPHDFTPNTPDLKF